MLSLSKKIAAGMFVPALLMTTIGCDTMAQNRTASGAGIGAVAGGVAGAIIGNQVGHHNAAAGALIGAAAGGLIGAGIGHYLNVRAERFKQVQDVEVEKVPARSEEQVVREYPRDEPRPQPEHIKLIINDTMLFEQGSATLQPYGTDKLNEIVRILNEKPDERIIVRGYASSEGGDEANQALSERRANAVRNFLVGHGVDGNRITSVGMGESNPIGDNTTQSGRSQNRRVEIEVFPGPSAERDSNSDSGSSRDSDYNRPPQRSSDPYDRPPAEYDRSRPNSDSGSSSRGNY